MNRWTPVMTPLYPDPNMDPFPGLEIPLLYGTLAYFLEDGRDIAEASMYNGAIVRDQSGLISGHYAKRVLMPFGEYVPFGDIFPWIRSLVPLHGEFSKGEVEVPLKLSLENRAVYAGILICYEDLVSDIAREYALRGADLLINLTNDAWYGDSPAPTSMTCLHVFGQLKREGRLFAQRIPASLPSSIQEDRLKHLFHYLKEAYTVSSVPLLYYRTLYTRFGDYPLYVVLLCIGGCLFFIRSGRYEHTNPH
jgi:apolipoprotein N-acyltransferase